jgi:hypothetical protein
MTFLPNVSTFIPDNMALHDGSGNVYDYCCKNQKIEHAWCKSTFNKYSGFMSHYSFVGLPMLGIFIVF